MAQPQCTQPFPKHVSQNNLPEDFPNEELAKRIGKDRELATLAEKKTKADARYERNVAAMERQIQQIRDKFRRSAYMLSATDFKNSIDSRIKQREKEIFSKLFREYWLKKYRNPIRPDQRKHFKRGRPPKQPITTTPPPNETIEGQSNGSLEGQNLDGARPENSDHQMPEQG